MISTQVAPEDDDRDYSPERVAREREKTIRSTCIYIYIFTYFVFIGVAVFLSFSSGDSYTK